MPIRRLINIINQISISRSEESVRNDVPGRPPADVQGKLAEPGIVTEVGDVGTVVGFNNRIAAATQVTDEPLFEGQAVWVAQSDDGTPLILGSIK